MTLCQRVAFIVLSWLCRVALAERNCGEVDSTSFRFLESLADFDDDGVYNGAYRSSHA